MPKLVAFNLLNERFEIILMVVEKREKTTGELSFRLIIQSVVEKNEIFLFVKFQSGAKHKLLTVEVISIIKMGEINIGD